LGFLGRIKKSMDNNKKFYKSVIPRKRLLSSEVFNLIQKSVPIATIDLAILRKKDNEIEILLIKRKIYPEQNKWCLIGGRILKGEKLKDTIKRQAQKELGISVSVIPPWRGDSPIRIFSDPKSDRQKHFICSLYPVSIKAGVIKKSGPEFSEVKWFSLKKLPKNLGFNHLQEINSILKEASTINKKI